MTLREYLVSVGFVPGENDKSLFMHPDSKIRIALHVDDYLVRGQRHLMEEFFDGLCKHLKHKPPQFLDDEQELYFVGLRITKSIQDGVTWHHMDQQRDIQSFVQEYGCEAVRPPSAPMPNKNLIMTDTTILSPEKQTQYRSAIGSLQYFVCGTQWHLAHPIARLAQFNKEPTVGAAKQLDVLVAWLSANADKKLSAPVLNSTQWEVFVDSDHAGDRELGSRSHTGVLILCNGAPIHWRSNKQPITAVSSAAAEIYALAEAARDARLNAWKAEEMGLNRPIPIEIQVDNAAGVSFQSKMNPDSKLKGMIDLRWKWVKELQDTRLIKAVKVATDYNISDILTKCHSRPLFNRLIELVTTKAEALASQKQMETLGTK